MAGIGRRDRSRPAATPAAGRSGRAGDQGAVGAVQLGVEDPAGAVQLGEDGLELGLARRVGTPVDGRS